MNLTPVVDDLEQLLEGEWLIPLTEGEVDIDVSFEQDPYGGTGYC